MKYVCIDDGAVAELTSGREYQSIDFEEGEKLINALSGKVKFLTNYGKVVLYQDNDGTFLTTGGAWKKKKYLVIDCEQSSLFTQLRSNESLTSFQKLLRFCGKHWSHSTIYNKHTEKLISGSSKAVLFPLRYTANSPFRVVIEREPRKERLKKRGMDGHFLLVYKSGHESGDSLTESADETNFNRVFDKLPDVYETTAEVQKKTFQVNGGQQLESTDLSHTPQTMRPVHMPLIEWMPLLTAKQQKFVISDSRTPHRLTGPAGTGKTLSLMLRTIRILNDAEQRRDTFHALLVTHSEATREAIKNALTSIDLQGFQERDRKQKFVSLSVETLASLCAKYLRQSISESEFIDRDAQDSKQYQKMYIEDSIEKAKESELPSFRSHLSEYFRNQIQSESVEALAELFQHEISVLIKGRAGDSFDVYQKCPTLKYGLPISNDADKGFVFSVFEKYQSRLVDSSQFDTDDVVISAVGQLDTPIWRRRRNREGYDFIAVDETHLFNINELHVFHYFTREVGEFPITFTVDQAQAVGDRGWNDISAITDLFGVDSGTHEENTSYSAIFRNSPAIVDFSHAVLASGATLFTNFSNTLSESQSAFTPEDERKSQPVIFSEHPDDQTMVQEAFRCAEYLQSKTASSRSQVLITSLSDDVLKMLRDYAETSNKPVTVLERRGDFTLVRQAEKSGHMVLGHADFVGGLEFNVVVVVGVDKGRVPHEGETIDSNSRNYASYAAHNRLYVAASRAKYALQLSGVKSRGPSELLRGSSIRKLIEGVPEV